MKLNGSLIKRLIEKLLNYHRNRVQLLLENFRFFPNSVREYSKLLDISFLFYQIFLNYNGCFFLFPRVQVINLEEFLNHYTHLSEILK